MFTQAEIRDQLPRHLQQFVAIQDYTAVYDSRDHAVWRYVLMQLAELLQGKAHAVYFEGLQKTGITLERIPSIEEMNSCLAQLGWRAIAVDGFIPPQVFMELQSLKVLAIAMDMRSIHHIHYTPAPDIIHEAAGHAPIIADEEYAEYLQRFGEIGMKAISNQWDHAVYSAVRELSIIKEDAHASVEDIDAVDTQLQELLAVPCEPSELALLTRLHWWTVEYGLVGDLATPKIFGAGLLSSLGEAASCLSASVKKMPLTTSAILMSYDITCTQPQLFVTKSCRHLTQVLEEYATTMCYQRGGAGSVVAAINSCVINTCEFTSGLQVTGLFTKLLTNALGTETYVGTSGPTDLAVNGNTIDAHGTQYHHSGFGSPVGQICNLMKPLEDASEYDLQVMDIRRGEYVCLAFLSGICITGLLKSITKHNGKLLLMSFEDCTVTGPDAEVLFEPGWGSYDMAVGDRINSVYAGKFAAKVHIKNGMLGCAEETIKAVEVKGSNFSLSVDEKMTLDLYTQIRCYRENGSLNIDKLRDMYNLGCNVCPDEWLLYLEILEMSSTNSALYRQLFEYIKNIRTAEPELGDLIDAGLRRFKK